MKSHRKERGSQVFTNEEWSVLGEQLGLSLRSLQVVRHIFDDCCEEEISVRLGIRRRTVHTHLERIYRKLGVHSRVSLVLRVFDHYLTNDDLAWPDRAWRAEGPDGHAGV